MLNQFQKQTLQYIQRANKLQLLKQEVYPKLKTKKNQFRDSIISSPVIYKKKIPKNQKKENNNKKISFQQEENNKSIKKLQKIKKIKVAELQGQNNSSPRSFKKWNQNYSFFPQQSRTLDLCQRNSEIVQPTNIEFEYRTNNLGNNLNPQSNSFKTSLYFHPTQTNFYNKKTNLKKNTNKNLHKNQSQPIYKNRYSNIKDLTQQNKQKYLKTKDSQTLLRKSSLFLLTFVKARQKQRSKQSHIGQMPALTQLTRLKQSYKNLYQINYDDFKIKTKTKTKTFILTKNDRSITLNQKKKQNHASIVPQPW